MLLFFSMFPCVADIHQHSIANIDGFSGSLDARVRPPKIGKVGVHDGILRFDGNAAGVHAVLPFCVVTAGIT